MDTVRRGRNVGLTHVHVRWTDPSLPLQGECMWATPLDGEHGVYRLESIPVFAYDVNHHDVLRCIRDDEGLLVVAEVLARSGQGTLRAFFHPSIAERDIRASAAAWRDRGAGVAGCLAYRTLAISAPFPLFYDLELQLVIAEEESDGRLAYDVGCLPDAEPGPLPWAGAPTTS